MGVNPRFSFTNTGGIFLARPGGVIFMLYTWNLERKLRNPRRPSLRGTELPLLLHNHED
jgi:hypothetical protein